MRQNSLDRLRFVPLGCCRPIVLNTNHIPWLKVLEDVGVNDQLGI